MGTGSLVTRFATFITIASGGFAADILTKWYVFQHYFRPPVRLSNGWQKVEQTQSWFIPGVLGIETTTNPGALFGMLAGMSYLFAALSIAALIGILFWLFIRRAAVDRWLNVCLAIISGGILGNLYDRLGFGFRPEYPEIIRHDVRDWILFRWEGIAFLDPWPNFNLADSLLVCGACLLVIHAFFSGRRSA